MTNKRKPPLFQKRRRCRVCGELKSWVQFSSSDQACITCKQVMYGQGLQGLQTYTTHEEKK